MSINVLEDLLPCNFCFEPPNTFFHQSLLQCCNRFLKF
jgi:hypothetical protein